MVLKTFPFNKKIVIKAFANSKDTAKRNSVLIKDLKKAVVVSKELELNTFRVIKGCWKAWFKWKRKIIETINNQSSIFKWVLSLYLTMKVCSFMDNMAGKELKVAKVNMHLCSTRRVLVGWLLFPYGELALLWGLLFSFFGLGHGLCLVIFWVGFGLWLGLVLAVWV